jgi:hypothetical protein
MRRRFARRQEEGWLRWIVAVAIVNIALLIPDTFYDFTPRAFLRIPTELAFFLLVPLMFPRVIARAIMSIAALALAVMVIVKIASAGVFSVFDRPLDPLADPFMATTALDTMARANIFLAVAAVLAAAVVIGGIVAALLWANGVTQRRADASPGATLSVAGVLATAAYVLAIPLIGDPPRTLAGADTTQAARYQIKMIRDGLRDVNRFESELAVDLSRGVPSGSLLSRLKGVDVLVVFVESYGRTALDTPAYAALIGPTLKEFDATLTAHGFAARSAWAVSPTFGGESWLAHSTLLSGLWIENQRRYQSLLRSKRATLISDFKRAGWRTVGVMPEITMGWPDADFFGYDAFYGAKQLAYAGAPFGYMAMPDQYALTAFNAREFASTDRPPLMAQIALISSHIPWAPIPEFVAWDQVGDGSIFTTARSPETAETLWRTPARVPLFYARSIDYVLHTLMSFIATYGRDNTLMIVLGDHQPVSFITGPGADHDVPIHLIARDQALLDRLAADWTKGMTPEDKSPVLPMDGLRARLLEVFTQSAEAP